MQKMVGDVLTMIDDQMARPVIRSESQRRQLFLYLREQQRALVRPLVNLDAATALAIHNRYQPDMKRRIYVVCAREINKPCYYCQPGIGGEERRCDADVSFMLPVYVYSLVDTRSNRRIMHRDYDGQEQPVAGTRLLELTAFGPVRDVLATFADFVHAGGDISACDWTLEQFVGPQGRLIDTEALPLKPIDPRLAALVPSQEIVWKSVLEYAPPISAPTRAASEPKVSPRTIDHARHNKKVSPVQTGWERNKA